LLVRLTQAAADPTSSPSASPLQGSCRWLGKSYPVVSLRGEPGVWRVIVPIPTSTPSGHQPLAIYLGEATTSTQVRILPHHYRHQHISLPPRMLASYDTPQSKADDERLLRELRRFVPDKYWQGSFGAPCAGPQSTPFGVRRTYNGWRKGWHRGQDVAVGCGTPLHAPAQATVGLTAAGLQVDGNAVVLHHGLGVASLYLHMSRFKAHPGQRLQRGEVFGWSGASGAGTGPHLHWATYVHGEPVEPGLWQHLPAAWR
jgi:murein DD-endopeptidase MepM/ murein hydrolase activator NlpD